MCFFSRPPVDNSAAIARQQEQARQARIATGQGSIDSAFQVFDPAYFEGFQKDFLNYYNPQVDEQFGDARRAIRYDLAERGILNSTPGQTKFADLIEDYSDRRGEIAANALSATNALRGDVERNKSELYAQNTQSADPSLAAQSAVSRAGSLMTPAVYSPLADLFAGAINTSAAALAGAGNRLPLYYQQLFQPGSTSSSRSYRVVN